MRGKKGGTIKLIEIVHFAYIEIPLYFLYPYPIKANSEELESKLNTQAIVATSNSDLPPSAAHSD